MEQVVLCTLLMTLNKLVIFTVIPKDNRHVKSKFFMLMLKNYFASLITGSFISCWSSSEEATIFVFNLKAGNALATSSIFPPEVFKPQTDELFVESLIDNSRKSSYFSRGILN